MNDAAALYVMAQTRWVPSFVSPLVFLPLGHLHESAQLLKHGDLLHGVEVSLLPIDDALVPSRQLYPFPDHASALQTDLEKPLLLRRPD